MPPSAKSKQIRARLEQIKAHAANQNARAKPSPGVTAAQLAEEAAGLGLELADLLDKRK